jgi:hypothetical protein
MYQIISDALFIVIIMFIFVTTAAPGICRPAKTLSDREIMNAVEDELSFDMIVSHYGIDVIVVKGVVALKGGVDSILAKERAERIASTVKEVRSIVNRIYVDSPFLRSDMEIREDIEDAFRSDPEADSYEYVPYYYQRK